MGNNQSSGGGGIGLSGAVFVVFLVLKLVGVEPVAGWSWVWVTSPLWIGLALVLALIVVFGGGIGAVASIGHISSWFRRRRALKRMYQED